MTNFHSLKSAFEKAGIETETKDKVSIVEKNKDALLLFAMSLQNARKNYLPSERLALSYGFVEIFDLNAYNERYFIKSDKIWIHDIGALKSKLGVVSDSELRTRGYDVETYYMLYSNSKLLNHDDLSHHLSYTDIGKHGERIIVFSNGVSISESECWVKI